MTIKNIHLDYYDASNGIIEINERLQKIKSVELNHFHSNMINNIREDNKSNQFQFNLRTGIYDNSYTVSIVPTIPDVNLYDVANARNFNISIKYPDGTTIPIEYTLQNYYYATISDVIDELNSYLSYYIANNQNLFFNDSSLMIRITYDPNNNTTNILLDSGMANWVFDVIEPTPNSVLWNLGFDYIFNDQYTLNSTITPAINYYQPTTINIICTLQDKYTDIKDLCIDLMNALNTNIQLLYGPDNDNELIHFVVVTNLDNYVIIQCTTNNIDDMQVNTNNLNSLAFGFQSYNYNNYILTANNNYDVTLWDNYNDSIITAYLPIGAYDNTTIINAFNNITYSSLFPSDFSLNYSIFSNVLSIGVNISGLYSFRLIDSPALRLLFGINDFNTYGGSTVINGTNSINIFYDAYLNLYIRNLNNNTNVHSKGKSSTFKIPIVDVNNKIVYNSSQQFKQIVYNTDESLTLNRFVIEFYDRSNNIIVVPDYSLSLTIDCL